MEHLKVTFGGIFPLRSFFGGGRSHQFYEQFKRQGLGSVILGFGTERRGGQKVLRISADIEVFPAQGNRVVLLTTFRIASAIPDWSCAWIFRTTMSGA